MCGLAGVFDATGARHNTALYSRMAARLSHRGPDDEGTYLSGPLALLHRRLSILDPTSAGHQPMCSEDGSLAILHNGEIYNFLELGDELMALGHRFRSRSDTEVMLAAYREWGLDFVSRFNGIWAFALWDAPRERLILSRDHFGVKPLFVAEREGTVYFASEIKALLEVPGISRDPNPAALRDFLVDGVADHADETFFSSVRRVPAAHSLVVERDRRQLIRHWSPPALATDATDAVQPGDADLVDELRQRVVNAVSLQLRSDVALGSCLSGGLDSSTIVSVAAGIRDGRLTAARSHAERDRPPQLAFFAEFREPGIDERRYVDEVIAATGVELCTVTPTADDFVDSLPVVLAHQDEPFASASIVVQYHVMQLAHHAGVTVLLDGQGADELFAGYPPFVAPRLGGALRAGQLAGVMRSAARSPGLLPSTLRYAVLGSRRRPRWLGGRQTPPWLGQTLAEAGTLWRDRSSPAGTVLAQTLWQQITGDGLPALLRYEDRNSMAFGIEARVPFLDLPLVEFALQLPDRLKIARGRRKVALLHAMRGIVPDAVRGRRDKIAFAPPQRRWLAEAAPRLAHLGVKPLLESEGFVRAGLVAAALERAAAGREDDPATWRPLISEMWLRRA